MLGDVVVAEAWQGCAVADWTYRTAVFGVATDLALGYRVLQQDYHHNDFDYDVTTYGPIIGAAFHF